MGAHAYFWTYLPGCLMWLRALPVERHPRRRFIAAGGESAISVVGTLHAGHNPELVRAIEDLRWAPPVIRPSKLICIDLNYRRHAAESGENIPAPPIIFAKLLNTLIGCGVSIVHPRITEGLDYEGELGVVIGARVTNVSVEMRVLRSRDSLSPMM